MSRILALLICSGVFHGYADPTIGRIAVFRDDIPASGAPASPDYLGRVLRNKGFEVVFLDSHQLADPEFLNHDRFDSVVLPYGASFPVRAAGNFRQFLRHGGKFLSTGGYAFDNLLERTGSGWSSPAPPPRPTEQALWRLRLAAAGLRGKGKLTFSGFLKVESISGPGMAYLAVYQFTKEGSIADWIDFVKVTGTKGWQEASHTFNVHPDAVTVELHAGLYRCQGTAWFDDLVLKTEVGETIASDDFEGSFAPGNALLKELWSPSDPRLCSLQSGSAHSGHRCLETRLNFEVFAPERLNTRHGRPADGLEVAPSQLGVFDADYRLERVMSVRPAPDQCIIPQSLCLIGSLEGWAASGVGGADATRWLPLVNGLDRYGRLRGAVGGMLRHFAGTYAGSSWAFFGVTNRDVFSPAETNMAPALLSIMRSLVRDNYVTSLESEPACCRQGETVRLSAQLFNGGRINRNLRFTVKVYEGEPPDDRSRTLIKPIAELETAAVVSAGKAQPAALEWSPGRFNSDFYYLVGQLWEGDEEIDRIESGFLVWDDRLVAGGPALNFKDNYLRLGNRPMFLFGTDDWSYTFTSRRETPLQWLRDMRMRRDFGVQIYENLQFGVPPDSRREQLLRKVDGIVQLAQKYQQVYFAGLLVGANVATGDAELATQTEYCRQFARRYAQVPGLIYYLNGDLRCTLSEAVTPQLNEFLRRRYRTDEELRAAWGSHAPGRPLGQIPAEDFNDRGFAWADRKAYDLNCFRAALIRRWSGASIRGIREHDASHPTSAEFYQLPHEGVDIPAGIDGLDLCNFGYFDKPGADFARFPAIFKYNDQRARGKSVGPGEYGVKTHPAWGDGQDYGYHIARTRDQAIDLFLAIAHYSLAMGGSRIHNWCWKDGDQSVFPWGMIYPCDQVPKDTAYVHRNQSLLFRHFEPVYTEPAVYVLTPDSHRLGGAKWKVIEGILKCFDLALACHPDNLGTLNEDGLIIPQAARVIFYPLPFCPTDETYQKIRDWVRDGGTLYLSGDISYAESRTRTRADRLTELCGVQFVGERYPNIEVKTTDAADQPCIRTEAAGCRVLKIGPEGIPLVTENRVGKGKVLFTPDPIELHSVPERREQDVALYRRALDAAGVQPVGLQPDDPGVHAFRLPLSDGGFVHVLFNTDERAPTKQITLTDLKPPIEISITRKRPALLWLDGRKRLRAVEAGDCHVGGKALTRDETGGILLGLDGKDLRESGAVVAMPLRAGQVQMASSRKWRRPVLFTGDIWNGGWQAYEQHALENRTGSLVFDVNLDQAFSLLLISEAGEFQTWTEAIAKSVKSPKTLP